MIKPNKLSIQSYMDIELTFDYIQKNSDTLIILLPGNSYGIEAPMLYYSFGIGLELGYDILAIEYAFQKVGKFYDASEVPFIIDDCRHAIDEAMTFYPYKNIIFVGKSFGTVVQSVLSEELVGVTIKHVFLTPVKKALPAMRLFESLVITGTDDPFFTSEDIATVSSLSHVTVKAYQDADHSMNTSSYKESLAILSDLADRIFEFMK